MEAFDQLRKLSSEAGFTPGDAGGTVHSPLPPPSPGKHLHTPFSGLSLWSSSPACSLIHTSFCWKQAWGAMSRSTHRTAHRWHWRVPLEMRKLEPPSSKQTNWSLSQSSSWASNWCPTPKTLAGVCRHSPHQPHGFLFCRWWPAPIWPGKSQRLQCQPAAEPSCALPPVRAPAETAQGQAQAQ